MPEASAAATAELLRMTAQVTAAYVANNPVPAQQLAELIRSIHASLAGLDSGPQPAPGGDTLRCRSRNP